MEGSREHAGRAVLSVEAFLRRDPFLHLYALGDLEPAEEAHTTWHGARGAAGALEAVVLVYRGLSTPTVLALGSGPAGRNAVRALLTELADGGALPGRFYAHTSVGVEVALQRGRRTLESLGRHVKMGLVDRAALDAVAPDARVGPLGPEDVDALVAFYEESYPESYFEAAVLARGPFVALRDERGIASVAGIHAFAPALRVAALGNIATRPDARGRGLARTTIAALCRRLAPDADTIGLNVQADNAAAIACYRRLGFTVVDEYDEWFVEDEASFFERVDAQG